VLKSLGIKDIPIINVFNKIDLVEERPQSSKENSIFTSAINNNNVDKLLSMIDEFLYKKISVVQMLIPFNRSEIYSDLKENSNVLTTDYKEDGINVEVEVNEYHQNKYKKFIK
jgi:GTP-binding protein HflX